VSAQPDPHAIVIHVGSKPAIARGQVGRVQNQAYDGDSKNDAQGFFHNLQDKSLTAEFGARRCSVDQKQIVLNCPP